MTVFALVNDHALGEALLKGPRVGGPGGGAEVSRALAYPDTFAERLAEAGVPAVAARRVITQDDRRRAFEAALEWVAAFRAHPVMDGYRLGEWLVHDGLELPWLIEAELVNAAAAAFTTFAELETLGAVAGDTLVVAGDRSLASRAGVAWARAHGLEPVTLDGRPAMARAGRPSWFAGWRRYRLGLSELIRRQKERLAAYAERHGGPPDPARFRGRPLLVSQSRCWEPRGGGFVERYWQEVTGALRGSAPVFLNIDVGTQGLASVESQPAEFIPLEHFIDGEVRERQRRMWASAIALWTEMGRLEAFQEAFIAGGVDLAPLVLPVLAHGVDQVFPAGVMYLETFKRALEALEPPALGLYFETGTYGRAAVAAARASGVRSVALQHGIVHDVHQYYVCRGDCSTRPLADVTAVYGEESRSALIGAGRYPAESVVVTGQPRYDEMVERARAVDRAEFLTSLGVDPDRPVLAAFTQPWRDIDERRGFVRACADAATRLGATLVIRPHPGERDDPVPAAELGGSAVIARGVDLTGLLVSCDAALIVTSTVGLEALWLDRPVVIVNLKRRPDPIPYFAEGAALGVSEASDLVGVLERVLFDEPTRSSLREGGERLASRHLYVRDGKAGERVARLLRPQ